MIDIDKGSENIKKSPFQEEIFLENYYACASRGEVLSQMIEAVQNGVTLMVLTGEEGSGKTMVCRLLEHEVAPLCVTVFFVRAVDSFEDVVQTIALRLGLDGVGKIDGGDVDQVLERITDFLLGESVDLFIIFDEAENIFLANLEKIREMLDRIIGTGVRMNILFSGRETLLENCDQLSICDFQNSDELLFELVPLSKAETADYLKHCCARLTDVDATKVFAAEDVNYIYSLAKGNFRMTNILGEESVKTDSNDTSFMVLLDGVEEGFEAETEKTKAINIPHFLRKYAVSLDIPHFLRKYALSLKTPHFLREYAVSLPWIGGALCSFLLLLFLFNFGDDESDVGQDIDQTEKAVQIETVTTVREVNVQLPEKKDPVTAESTDKSQSANDKETVLQVSEKNAPADEVLVVMPVEKSPQQNIDQEQRVFEQTVVKVNGTVEKDEKFENGTVDETVAKEAVEAQEMQTSQETVTSGVVNIIKLHPTHVKKNPAISSEPQRVIIKAQPRKEVRNVVSLNGPFTANQLYDARVSAGLGWDSREKERMYTVQLMVLTSKTAEKNLKKMLAQVNYRQEAGNFYILKKDTLPEKIFIFYGEYPSIERARLAQKSLPKFLRDHKPYALSIKGAIAKVRK